MPCSWATSTSARISGERSPIPSGWRASGTTGSDRSRTRSGSCRAGTPPLTRRSGTCRDPATTVTVEGDVLEALRLPQDRAHRDHQDVEQPVLDLPLAARILDRLERGDQGFQHGLPPSGKAE